MRYQALDYRHSTSEQENIKEKTRYKEKPDTKKNDKKIFCIYTLVIPLQGNDSKASFASVSEYFILAPANVDADIPEPKKTIMFFAVCCKKKNYLIKLIK